MRVSPCLECRLRAQGDAQPLHPFVPRLIVACLVANVGFEVVALLLGPEDLVRSAALMVVAVVAGVLLIGVWLLGVVLFLVWFVWALQRGVGQGAPRRALLAAVVWWFVPGANLVVPWLQLRAAFHGGRRELIDAWWVAFACAVLTHAVTLAVGEAVFPGAVGSALECLTCMLAAVAITHGTRFLNEHEPARLLARR